MERLKTGGGQFVTDVTDNMKARAKKALVADKVERFKTGGGQFVTDVTDITQQSCNSSAKSIRQ